MTIGRREVLHVARLAELAVDEADLPRLVEQLNDIVNYVSQLDSAQVAEETASFLAGPHESPLRPDVINPQPLAFGPARLGPETADGFFLVPRLGQMEDA